MVTWDPMPEGVDAVNVKLSKRKVGWKIIKTGLVAALPVFLAAIIDDPQVWQYILAIVGPAIATGIRTSLKAR
jgi:uncharacterized membrane protein YgaE (UPF0421/DUF939 family)